MPKNNEVNFEQFFELPNPGLKSYFGRVRKGQSEEYRTKFFQNKSLSEVLDGWSATLEQGLTRWSTLLDFENDMKGKVGPLSIMKPLSERMDDIDNYYSSISSTASSLSEQCIKSVLREFNGVKGMQPRSQSETVKRMRKSTNSGSPYFTKRRLVVDKSVPVKITTNGESVTQTLQGKDWPACAILGWRGQEGGPTDDDVKQRVVWMFPFALNIAELQVYQPLIERAQKLALVPAWISMECVDERITQLFDTKSPEDLIICTDFSKFDQHFNSEMQSGSRAILCELLNTSEESKWWLDNVFPAKYVIPLAYDYGKIRFGYHGMGSGSGGTNADETLAHRALQYEAAQSASQRLNLNSQCLGDDGILSYPGCCVDDVVKSYSAHGLEMNPDKQYASTDDCVYLRRWHHKDYRVNGICVGVYSTYRALGRLCEQERFYDPEIWSKEMVALRQLSILENCKYHPLAQSFVDYCMKGDKYRLGLDIPGFFDNIDSIVSKATDVIPDFLGYVNSEMSSQKGIKSWWIYKYLKSKA